MVQEFIYPEDITIKQIEGLINSDYSNLPQKVSDYILMMEKARDWHYQNKSKREIINHLRAVCKDKKGGSISDMVANKVYCDALNFFYLNVPIHKQAYRNLYAEKMELAAAVSWNNGDMETYGRNLERAGKLRQLDLADPVEVDKEAKKIKNIIYAIDAKDVGVEGVDRQELARLIDNLDAPETKKQKAKKDAGIEQRDLIEDMEL
jgi:hypothetical protein